MATFTPLFDITQSSSGLVGTISDTSNYDDNTDDIAVTDFSARVVTILDAYGEPYATVTFSGADLTADFAIDDINLWAASTMSWTGIEPVADYEKTLSFPLGRVTENNYQKLLRKGCCTDGQINTALGQADEFLRGSSIAAVSGNASLWQQCQDAANKYLKSVYLYGRALA